MCSIDGNAACSLPLKDNSKVSKNCMKCGQPATVVIRINDAFCSECFSRYCTHKFRSSFGKSKLVRDEEAVLVAFSGGACSTALVHLVQEGLSKRAQKKLRFRPTLVHIDEGSVLGVGVDDHSRSVSRIRQLMQASGLPHHVCCLHDIFDETNDLSSGDPAHFDILENGADLPTDGVCHSIEGLTMCDDPQWTHTANEAKLAAIISSARTLTAKESIVRLLRLHLLVHLSRRLGMTKIVVGDTASRLSVRMLAGMSQGRGAQLPLEMGFSDDRYGDVMFVRPLREFTSKEVAMYNQIHQVHVHFIPGLDTKVSGHASIEKLTEEFICGLQSQSPTTVNTICRTGEKLGSTDNTSSEKPCCSLCQASLDTAVSDSSALVATEFSLELTRRRGDKKLTNHDEPDCHGDGGRASNLDSDSHANFYEALCYGCRRLADEIDDLLTLPTVVYKRKVNRERMKTSIQKSYRWQH